MVASQIARDLEDPRALVSVRLVCAAQGAQERFLRQVFGGGAISKEPPEEPVNRLPVPHEKIVDLGAVHVRSLLVETSRRRNPLTGRLD